MGKGKSAAAPKKGSGVLTPLVTAGAVLSLVVALIVAYNAGLTRVHTAQRAGARDDASGGGADDTGRRPAQRAAPARAGARAAGEPRDAIALQAALREQASAEQASAKQTAATAAADASACEDSNDSCGAWAEAGECDNNPGFMRGNCARSCRQCTPPPTSGPLAWMLPPLAGVDWAALDAADRDEPPPSDDDLARHCAVASLLSPLPIRGLHVVCALPSGPAAADRSAPPLAGARLAVWRDADRSAGGGRPSHVFRLPRAGGGARTMAELLSVLGARLRFEWRGAQWQPPAWFTPDGVRLLTVAAVSNRLGSGMPLCVFEGGQFIWPPGEVDTARKVALPDGHLATIRTLSIQPIVLSIEDFLQPDETGHMIQRALPHLAKSGVALKDHDLGKEAKEFRTSSQFFLPTDGDARLEDVDARVQALMRVPITHAEYIQVLRYNHNEHYSAHHDYFDPREYASNKHMRQETKHGAKNRLATVFFYLSDVAEGGATNFPRAGGRPPPHDFFDCSRGLSVFPQNGKVIVFYSMHPSSELDPFSLHGGCDVLNGTKFSANFWLWNEPYHFSSPHRLRAFEAYRAKMWALD